MTIGTTPLPIKTRQRKVPRYKLAVPLGLTVLRSGMPDKIPGSTTEIGEGGMGVVVASRLLLGESVRVEFLLPHTTTPVHATALVRYQHEHRWGLQFLRMPDQQHSIIRYWTRREADVLLTGRQPKRAPASVPPVEVKPASAPLDIDEPEDPNRKLIKRRIVSVAAGIMLLASLVGYWRWHQGWKELEAQVAAAESAAAATRVRVPFDVMQQRTTHQVVPEYPEDARQAGVQGTVVLDVVVNAEGKVTQVKAVSGPEALTPAACEAVRRWRYDPYRVNGQPAPVDTTVAVDFRLPGK